MLARCCLQLAQRPTRACKQAVAEGVEGLWELSEKEAAEAAYQVFANSLESYCCPVGGMVWTLIATQGGRTRVAARSARSGRSRQAGSGGGR